MKSAPRFTPADLQAHITASIETLATETDEFKAGETWAAFLKFSARFYNYSANNRDLIHWQRPNATYVKGYSQWLDLHRCVKHGEKGIAILAPCPFSKEQENPKTGEKEIKSGIGFRVAYVFDIEQTEPLPGYEDQPLPVLDWKSTHQDGEISAALAQYAQAQGFTVQYAADIHGSEAQGCILGTVITLRHDAGTKTLAHELAHGLHGHQADRQEISREQKELEAESTAYIVADFFGIPGLKCPFYLTSWGADAKTIRAAQARISETAKEIINAVLAILQPQEEEQPTEPVYIPELVTY